MLDLATPHLTRTTQHNVIVHEQPAQRKDNMTPDEFKRKYNTVDKLPKHVFSDRALCKPVGEELRTFLTFLAVNEPDTLKYLHRKGQEYIDYGGAHVLSFDKWLGQLKTSLKLRE